MEFIQLKTRNFNHVPYRYNSFSFTLQIIIIIMIVKSTECEHKDQFRPVPLLQPIEDYYFDKSIGSSLNTEDPFSIRYAAIDSSEPTPPLNLAQPRSIKYQHHFSDNTKASALVQCNDCSGQMISANKVFKVEHYAYEPDNRLFSPIFNLNTQMINSGPSIEKYLADRNIYSDDAKPQNLIDINNGFDLIESGSGAGSYGHTFDDSTNVLEDSNSQNELVNPTPVLNPLFDQHTTPSLNDYNNYNRPPVVNRRLPKLAVTAGQVWSYFLPYDTFVDEDGDLRQLKSMVAQRRWLNQAMNSTLSGSKQSNNNTSTTNDSYYSWLQYDPKSYLLYGFPTENDSGKHEIVLIVSDQFGATSNETIEINVRQHQSTRAFTHLFVANHVVWDIQSFPSVVDAMGEFVKRISTKVYPGQTFKNFVVQYYNINNRNLLAPNAFVQSNESPTNQARNSTNMSFTIAWSNSLIPIYPCNLTYLESMLRLLIDTQTLDYDWTIEKSDKLEFAPSSNLIKALGPEFKLNSVSINLRGSCEAKILPQNNNVQEFDDIDSLPRIRIKIGKLNWKLGEPIEYRIPSETFTADKGNYTARDLQLSVHTIDGLTLDKDRKYNFLEFDQDSQTLYGLPYNQEDHSGQRELQLTASHPKTGYKVREVFLISIEPQDLTTINNRALKLSVYLISRTIMFGPRERVSLSHKILGALRVDTPTFLHERENPQMIVLEVQKFSIGLNFKNEKGLHSFTPNYEDRISRIMDYSNDRLDSSNTNYDVSLEEAAKAQSSVLYKFTWTNETIGYRGDCPVEVIKENILYALEQSMLEFKFPDALLGDESEKNDSMRFHDRLRLYFEPDSDLIHLRFEPLGACINALELHDVGNGDFADQIDRAGDSTVETNQEPQPIIDYSPPVMTQTEVVAGNDEYWSIVLVLIIMVMVFIFVVVMLVLGLHTYKINQDKRFELQVRLAQARQNSMYLSSMILANQATPNEVCGQMLPSGTTKSLYVIQDEEKGSRKPVILENEKQFFDRSNLVPSVGLRPTTVHLSGQTVHTMPMKPNMTFTLDSIASANLQSNVSATNPYSSALMSNYLDDKQRSVTLCRRPSQSMQRFVNQKSLLNHSQSIITVASLAKQTPMIPQANLPIMYAQVPIFNEHPSHLNFASLQRGLGHQKHPGMLLPNCNAQITQPENSTGPMRISQDDKANGLKINGFSGINLPQHNKTRSPSYSSSNSVTNQSVI